MALSILKGLLQGYVQSLFDEGIVNDQFSQIHTLKSEEEPEHVVQLIDKYFVDVETILSELTSKIDCPDVDFSKLSELVHKVDERSLSIGAKHVKLACADLIKSCDQMNKENFSRALIWIKNEFSHTRNKLEAYAQLFQEYSYCNRLVIKNFLHLLYVISFKEQVTHPFVNIEKICGSKD
uniref:Histidine-containing phosphotransfer protein n=1 Tax=Quercus lobata TaxID=97700 RepID=A0A7N2KM22_QUELO